jgi:predicted amidophosphoribosyltransferase
VPTVGELTEPYGNFLLNPSRTAEGFCRVCRTFTYDDFSTCYPCGHQPRHADAVLPISYSPHLEQLHHVLSGYKRLAGQPARKFQLDLAAILWRFLDRHEACLASSLGAGRFEVVTTVPSGTAERDAAHPLHEIVGETVKPTADRYERLLTRTGIDVTPRAVSDEKFEVVRPLDGESILLIDDTWTTGASVQSAAGSLKGAGAGWVGVVVTGRHVRRDYQDNDRRLRSIGLPFDWDVCALEA